MAEDVDSAAAKFGQALAVAEGEHGPDDEALIAPLWWLSKAARACEDDPSPKSQLAVEYGDKAVRLAEKHWMSDPKRLASILLFHVVTLQINENTEEALKAARRAERLLTSAGADLRVPLQMIAEMLMFAGRGEEGLPRARELVRLEILHDGTMTWYAHYLLINLLRLAGEYDEALRRGREFLRCEGKHAANEGWKDVVRPIVRELEGRVCPGGEPLPERAKRAIWEGPAARSREAARTDGGGQPSRPRRKKITKKKVSTRRRGR